MTNPYYTPSGTPGTGTPGSSADVRAELALIEAGFGKLPTLSGNALEVVRVNAATTALEAVPQADLLAGLGLIDMANEVTVTGATSLTAAHIGKSVVITDSGSPADYTVTLPAGTAAGSLIMIRVSTDCEKLYTVAGDDVGLDGQSERVLWRGESCLLLREAANWTKVGGRTIPFRGVLLRASSQSITSGVTWQQAEFTDEAGDAYSLDLCFDVAEARFVAPRIGSYSFAGYASIVATVTGATTFADLGLSINGSGTVTGTPASFVRSDYFVGDARRIMHTSAEGCAMNAGGYCELLARVGTGTSASLEYIAGTVVTSMSYCETPLW